jgi:LmbE family N-acetylglucosaminyl deacetylase
MDTIEPIKTQQVSKKAIVIVAHPDDETLWAGGTILGNPSWQWFIISLCRGKDTDRAPKFKKVLKLLQAEGTMDDLDDGPEQKPLDKEVLENMILGLIPSQHTDLIISHSPKGEYTRHLRHEEIGKAVIKLWKEGKIVTDELWLFAYEDGEKKYYPIPIRTANRHYPLTAVNSQKKRQIITGTYGFTADSWEARTCPKTEAFWQFTDPSDAHTWSNKMKNKL